MLKSWRSGSSIETLAASDGSKDEYLEARSGIETLAAGSEDTTCTCPVMKYTIQSKTINLKKHLWGELELRLQASASCPTSVSDLITVCLNELSEIPINSYGLKMGCQSNS
ncbi:hypothetical protein ILYODFUR_021136 [Ilyodon furcidens]|uniref:Uncharacterized protein n=1 Tax=Ilyodon furcidens TaxID=33524 RepID=A0ABV0SN35_9TELE